MYEESTSVWPGIGLVFVCCLWWRCLVSFHERETVSLFLRGSRTRGNSRRHEPLNDDDKSSINEDIVVFLHSAFLLSFMILNSTVVSGWMPKFDVKTCNSWRRRMPIFLAVSTVCLSLQSISAPLSKERMSAYDGTRIRCTSLTRL